ncbi:unnamed protein product [Rotaria magnacalcarata]|uniref:Uncharacterized protein n=2 Tax=Rotaria magnacalcarata TaxID=392030 RepID=A0A815R8F1_9BILA|nr:unnamed protein product [Rotaria magnacalcarata]CAF1525618.1 unnamed protein product [Rotaria magnacalcarata]CAF2065935.1 unnamed protein product [Rotaria magnacalcarata]CAF2102693.1 unnamed protein product [Rotaria magnacalcarata]CAF2207697.1 unnamed protein product [Rotaria magnacalcarata]
MATSRVSNGTILSASKNERRQVQARIRAIQQRTNALNEELSHSSSMANTAVRDIEQTYMAITREFQEQRDQLLRRIHHIKQNIQQSTSELEGIRKNLRSTESFQLPQSTPRQSTDMEAHEMNAMVDDIERVLSNIAQQLKQYRFKPAHGHALGKTLGKINVDKNASHSESGLSSSKSIMTPNNPYNLISVHKLYTVDLDISAEWIVSSMEDRLFLCNSEGEVRIFSYSRRRRRQPLLTERFHLSTIRLISSFTATQDYLVSFEIDTHTIALHTHHGALLVRLDFPYDPMMIVRCDYFTKNQFWSCSRTKRQCIQFSVNHATKEITPMEQLDFKRSIAGIVIDPIGISSDDHDRVGIHDINHVTTDRLLIYTNNRNMIVPLDSIKYADRQLTSQIDRVLLVPKQPNLIVILYAPQSAITNLHEIVIVDIESQPAQILQRLQEPNGIKNIDVTLNGEIVYSVTPPANKRIVPKIHIYSLVD